MIDIYKKFEHKTSSKSLNKLQMAVAQIDFSFLSQTPNPSHWNLHTLVESTTHQPSGNLETRYLPDCAADAIFAF